MTEAIHCIGCGAIIQTENPHELGYTPKTAFEKGMETGEVYCQRCFRLRHYNDIHYNDIINIRILKTDALSSCGNAAGDKASVFCSASCKKILFLSAAQWISSPAVFCAAFISL